MSADSQPNDSKIRVPLLPAEHVVTQLAQRFQPWAKITGPLFAGTIETAQHDGNLYLTETEPWLWLRDHCETHRDAYVQLSPREVCRYLSVPTITHNLLDSLQSAIAMLQQHLQRINERAESPTSLIGYYLHEPIALVTDACSTASFFSLNKPSLYKQLKPYPDDDRESQPFTIQ